MDAEVMIFLHIIQLEKCFVEKQFNMDRIHSGVKSKIEYFDKGYV